MMVLLRLFFLVGLLLGGPAGVCIRAADTSLVAPANKLDPAEASWRELAEKIARRPDTRANFEERRHFPFNRGATVLTGEVRVSRERGLSLHYQKPQERTIIFDAQGMLVRDPAGKAAPPPDPRANTANAALRHILRFDFAALGAEFELYGRRLGEKWSLALVPRADEMRRAIGTIFVEGEADFVRMIELYRSARQHIDIAMTGVDSSQPFTADEVKRYFR